MNNRIITVTDMTKSFLYDLEVPIDLPIEKLKIDIVEALNGYQPNLSFKAVTTVLYFNRLGRQLQAEETIESAGVWNGDYITLIEV